MGICTKCGAIMHDDNAINHKCNPLAVPQKGKAKEPQTTEVDIDDREAA